LRQGLIVDSRKIAMHWALMVGVVADLESMRIGMRMRMPERKYIGIR
jgi:hypothetical protein